MSQYTNDFLFITLDSLRLDVAVEGLSSGRTPNLRSLVREWHPRQASATYTLPSHISMFSGLMPRKIGFDDAALYTGVEERLFALSTSWAKYRGRHIRYFFENAANVPKGFESEGYQTIGVGGVGWFSNEVRASAFWERDYFQHFLYRPEYGEQNPDGFETQVTDLSAKMGELPRTKRFVFINATTTHRPYSRGDGSLSFNSQLMCLRYIDEQLPRLLELFAPGTSGVICADHGDCLGEDGKWGHGFVHPKVMDVPYAEFTL